MIFIGPELSDQNSHFATNIIASIGSDSNLVIDLYKKQHSNDIFEKIKKHLESHDERYIIYNAYEEEDFFLDIKNHFPSLRLVVIFSDDEWRHVNYDRYLALYSDIFTVAVKENIKKYLSYGLDPFYMQWACNPKMFYPLLDQEQEIDVSFIGAAYGARIDYIRALIANGVNVRVYGRGWEQFYDISQFSGGYLTHDEMIKVISCSKINLNFLWTSREKDRCTIKGRTLELAACRAFQLSNYTDEFGNYGFNDADNIAVFYDKESLLNKVRYYLQHADERYEIATRAYEHVLNNHTWTQRFQAIFERLEKASSTEEVRRKYRLMVLVREGIRHQISCDDHRMDIQLVDPETDWKARARNLDGVIRLENSSTLNNDSLYMMAFGLVVDESDAIAANFYVGSDGNPCWIRFRDQLIERKRSLLGILPNECLMFAGSYIGQYGYGAMQDLEKLKVSYIEYPSFLIRVSYFEARKLRLYFAHHGDSRVRFKGYVYRFKLLLALSLGVDKVWQKIIVGG